MSASQPTIYVIAGCNGAGKTTFAREFLPREVKCLRFLNADEIARGLSPLAPSAASVAAARLLLAEFRTSVRRAESFAVESTLSGRTYVRLLRQARATGFRIELHYLWLANSAQAVARVRERVRKGGHAVPAADIRRRFQRSLSHLLADYLPLADAWVVWDNSQPAARVLASSSSHAIPTVKPLIKA